MKKHLQFIMLTTGLLLLVLWAVGSLSLSIKDVSTDVRKQALNVEGRRLLFLMKQHLDQEYERTGRYPTSLGPETMKTERYGSGFITPLAKLSADTSADAQLTNAITWWGVKDYQTQAAEICPDCVMTEHSYKLLTVGNLDEDPDLDVWVQSSADKSPVHMKKD